MATTQFPISESDLNYVFQQIAVGGAGFQGIPKYWKDTGNPFYYDLSDSKTFKYPDKGELIYGYGHLVKIKNGETTSIKLLYDINGKSIKTKQNILWKFPYGPGNEPESNILNVFWSDFYDHMYRILNDKQHGKRFQSIWQKLNINQKVGLTAYVYQRGSWSGFANTAENDIVTFLENGDYKNAALFHGKYAKNGLENGGGPNNGITVRRVIEALFIAGYTWDEINKNGGKKINNTLWKTLDSVNSEVNNDRIEDNLERSSSTIKTNIPKILSYQSFFDRGRAIDKFWGKWSGTVKSPLDITILLNPPNVGLFNPVVPYCFDAGSELHLMILNNVQPINYVNIGTEVIGTVPVQNKKNTFEANWALLPWSNLFADFVTINNDGQYRSDDDSLSFDELIGRNTDIKLVDIVSFKRGIHFTDAGWTQRGIEIVDSIKTWPGGLIYHDNHVEVLLHISKNNGIITCAGNVGLSGENKSVLNDSFLGVKSYRFLSEFSDENQIFIMKRGSLSPYTNGLGGTIKRTSIFNEYEQRLRGGDTGLTSKAFDLVQDVMEM